MYLWEDWYYPALNPIINGAIVCLRIIYHIETGDHPTRARAACFVSYFVVCCSAN